MSESLSRARLLSQSRKACACACSLSLHSLISSLAPALSLSFNLYLCHTQSHRHTRQKLARRHDTHRQTHIHMYEHIHAPCIATHCTTYQIIALNAVRIRARACTHAHALSLIHTRSYDSFQSKCYPPEIVRYKFK